MVRARLDAGVSNRAGGVAKFCAEVAGLDAELSKSIRRGPHDEAGTIEEINQVGIVIDTIQDKVVLLRALSVRDKITRAASACVSKRRCYTGSQLRDINPVASIE